MIDRDKIDQYTRAASDAFRILTSRLPSAEQGLAQEACELVLAGLANDLLVEFAEALATPKEPPCTHE